MTRRTAILIDDNPDELDLLEAALKEVDPGVLCTSFIYSDEAVRVVRDELRYIPKFIFIDVNMPRKTGAECLLDFRMERKLSDSKIILFSSIMPSPVAANFRSMGADFAIQKPASRSGYKEVLRWILDQQRNGK